METYKLNIETFNKIKEEIEKNNEDIYEVLTNKLETIIEKHIDEKNELKRSMIRGNMVSIAVRMFKMNSRNIALKHIVEDLKNQEVFDCSNISHQTIRNMVETNKHIFLNIGFSTKIYQQFGRKNKQGVGSEDGYFLIDEAIGLEIANYLDDILEDFKKIARKIVFSLYD